jgi:hypothetical protein
VAQGVDAASFEFYEGIRIFIPGAATVGLASGVGQTFGIKFLDVAGNEVIGILIALAVGLFFYFVDAPAKAAVTKPLQPTEFMSSWGGRPRTHSTLNVYLLILDTDIPPAIRARALYMGSMFRIGFEVIYLLLVTSCGVLLSSSFRHANARPMLDLTTERVAFFAATLAVYVFALRRDFILPLWTGRGRPGPGSRTPVPWDVKFRRFSSVDAVIVGVCLGAQVIMLSLHSHLRSSPLALPALLVLSLWGIRYFRGYKSDDGRNRVPIDALHASLLAAAAVVLSLASQVSTTSRLSPGAEACWSLGALIALVLIVARGHERRLRGSYSSQNSWLTENKAAMRKKYFN